MEGVISNFHSHMCREKKENWKSLKVHVKCDGVLKKKKKPEVAFILYLILKSFGLTAYFQEVNHYISCNILRFQRRT